MDGQTNGIINGQKKDRQTGVWKDVYKKGGMNKIKGWRCRR